MIVQEMVGSAIPRVCSDPATPTQRSWYLAATHTEKPRYPAAQHAILPAISRRQRHLPTKIAGQQLEQKDTEAAELSQHGTRESRLVGMTWIPGQEVRSAAGLTLHLCDTLQGLSVTHNPHRRLTLPSLPTSSGLSKSSARAWQPTGLEHCV